MSLKDSQAEAAKHQPGREEASANPQSQRLGSFRSRSVADGQTTSEHREDGQQDGGGTDPETRHAQGRGGNPCRPRSDRSSTLTRRRALGRWHHDLIIPCGLQPAAVTVHLPLLPPALTAQERVEAAWLGAPG